MDPLDSYPPYMSATEVSEVTGISIDRLNAWRKAGRGPDYIKVGEGRNGAVRYPREDLRRYLDERTVRHSSAPAEAVS
jgi:predicted site-specific integrase-resolvase